MTAEPEAQLSPAEQRFAAIRRRIGRYAGPIAFLLIWHAPLPALSPAGHIVAGVSVLAVIWWVTEAVPLAITAMFAPALAVLLGAGEAKATFAPFAHPLIFLFLGGFLLAEGLVSQGFDRRAALWLLSRQIVAGSPGRAATLVCVVAFGFSMWISNTATTAMMIPIVVGLGATMEATTLPAHRPAMRIFGEGMLITLAYAASLGGISTPIGTAPNMVALAALHEHLGLRVDFLQWMSFALPTSVAALAVMLVVARRRFPSPVRRIDGLTDEVRRELAALGPLSSGEKRALSVFALAIAGWITPAVLRLAMGSDHPVTLAARESFSEGIVAVVCASLLFVLPVAPPPPGATALEAPPPILTWRRASAIDWGTLLLLGGGMALGKLVFETGVAAVIGDGVVGLTAGGDATLRPLLMLVACTTLVVFLTEVTSNTATTSMMLPVLIAAAMTMGIDPVPVVLAVTMAASCAFMLPVSTPPNAMAYGTGRVRIGSMIRLGVQLDFAELALLLVVGTAFLPLLSFS
ncbi:MAG: DASS family sodium-coupled anion symporter [Myxococcales bacterium FL481]|nr:MAG: DASS family sodium-coupled anion symporter [Myxococcales bacterium FL481]